MTEKHSEKPTQDEERDREREEQLKDLDVPEDKGDSVSGGAGSRLRPAAPTNQDGTAGP